MNKQFQQPDNDLRRTRDTNSQCRHHGGQALVPVIFIMLILTTVAISFATSAKRELRAASNFSLRTQRFYAAKGALTYAAAALAQTSKNGSTYGVVSPNPDVDSNGWLSLGDAWIKIEVTDTASGINLNTISAAALQKLPIFQSNPDIPAAIVDWRTTGETASQNGAKSDYYQTLSPPYNAKNAPYDSVDELLLVKGVTPAMLANTLSGAVPSRQTGSGINGNAQILQPTPSSTGTAAGTPAAPSTDFSTIYNSSVRSVGELFSTTSLERNLAVDGSARVNINKATSDDLQKKLGLTQLQATRLIDFRNGGSTGSGGTGGTGGAGGGGTGGGTGGTTGGGLGSSSGGPAGMKMKGGGVLGRPGGGRPGGLSGQSGGASGGQPRGLSRQAAKAGIGGGGSTGLGNGSAGMGSGSGSGTGSGTGGGGASGSGSGTGGGGTGSGSGAAAKAPTFKSIADLLEVRGMTRTVMQSIADKVATDDKPFREGVINLNTAPPEVLATVAGMNTSILSAIMTYRQSGQAFNSLNDLFTITNLQRTDFESVAAHLTAKSSIYQVHIKVRMNGQASMAGYAALVELTDNGPLILQWREVQRSPGWSSWVTPPTLTAPTGSASSSSTGY